MALEIKQQHPPISEMRVRQLAQMEYKAHQQRQFFQRATYRIAAGLVFVGLCLGAYRFKTEEERIAALPQITEITEFGASNYTLSAQITTLLDAQEDKAQADFLKSIQKDVAKRQEVQKLLEEILEKPAKQHHKAAKAFLEKLKSLELSIKPQ